jgi:hypothetical protein
MRKILGVADPGLSQSIEPDLAHAFGMAAENIQHVDVAFEAEELDPQIAPDHDRPTAGIPVPGYRRLAPGFRLCGDERGHHPSLDSRLVTVREHRTLDVTIPRQGIETDTQRSSQSLVRVEIEHQQRITEIGAFCYLFTICAQHHDHIVHRPRPNLVHNNLDEPPFADLLQVLGSTEPNAGVNGKHERDSSIHRSSSDGHGPVR